MSTMLFTGFEILILSEPMVTVRPLRVSADIDKSLQGKSGEIRQLVMKSFCSRPCSSNATIVAVPTLLTVKSLPAAVTRTEQGRMSVQSLSSKVADDVAPESITQESTCLSPEVKKTKVK